MEHLQNLESADYTTNGQSDLISNQENMLTTESDSIEQSELLDDSTSNSYKPIHQPNGAGTGAYGLSTIDKRYYHSSMFPNQALTYMNISSKKQDFENVCDYIEAMTIIEPLGAKGERKVKLLTQDSQMNAREIVIKHSSLYSAEKLNEELNKYGFILANPSWSNALVGYIAQQTRALKLANKIEYQHSSLGWHTANNGELMFLLDDAIGSSITSKYTKDFNFVGGDEAIYNNLLENIVLKSENLQLALVSGLSSIVISLLKEATGINAIFLDIAGISSTGKSTTQQFICSLYGNPKQSNKGLFRTFNGTVNSFFSANESMHGVPIVIDDSSSKESAINWESFVYQMTAGEAKSRCNGDGDIRNGSDGWDGLIVISSEHSILENSNAKLGAVVRLLLAEDIVWTKNAEESNEIKRTVLKNYGFVAPKFVQGLIDYVKENEIETIKDRYYNEVAKIKKLIIEPDNLTSRVCEQIGMLAITTELVNEILGYQIDKNKIIKPFVDRENLESQKRDPSISAFEMIKANSLKFRKQFRYKSIKNEASFENCIGTIKNEGSFKIVNILSTTVNDWLLKNGYTQTQAILKKWRDAGKIKCDAGHLTVKEPLLDDARCVSFIFELDTLQLEEYPETITKVENKIKECRKSIERELYAQSHLEEEKERIRIQLDSSPSDINMNFDDSAEIDKIFRSDANEN